MFVRCGNLKKKSFQIIQNRLVVELRVQNNIEQMNNYHTLQQYISRGFITLKMFSILRITVGQLKAH